MYYRGLGYNPRPGSKPHTTYSNKTKFYRFDQHDNGYSCFEDHSKGISHWVFIEALSAEDALARARTVGLRVDLDDEFWLVFDNNRFYIAPEGRRWMVCPNAVTIIRPNEHWRWPREREFGKWAHGPEGYIHYDDGRVESFYH